MTQPADEYGDLEHIIQRINDSTNRMLAEQDGTARQAHWLAKDGWVIGYTTSRVQGGPEAGKFVTQAFKPVGVGARSGKATQWVETYRRAFSTRKAAKARAEALYAQHSPQWAKERR